MPTSVQQPVVLPETGFLRQPQVLQLVPISKSTLWRRVFAGSFPAPVKLSCKITAWRAEDLRLWINEQASLSPGQTIVKRSAATVSKTQNAHPAKIAMRSGSSGGAGLDVVEKTWTVDP